MCLAAPPSLKMKDGYHRCLIRSALDGILPKRVQWRTTKTPFSPDYFGRYNAQLGKVREFVASIRPNDPIRSAIDVAHLSSLMQSVPLGVRSQTARDVVPATIFAICFLRQFADYRL
jgi:asparagine synthase (glutamine-hydrolysing)